MSISRKVIRLCAFIVLVSGLIILATTLYPIFSYEWYAEQKFPKLLTPLVDVETATFKFEKKDYTKLSNWFEEKESAIDVGENENTYFTVTVPKLNIDNAVVKIGGEDLSNSLIQYPGTASPGQVGNTVIFGHSVLPQFFDPKNYLTIFSKIDQLESGDDIYLFYDNYTLVYQVETMFEVKPTDAQILEQNRTRSYLTLVTCTPPGHPLKPRRLVIRAKLVDNKI